MASRLVAVGLGIILIASVIAPAAAAAEDKRHDVDETTCIGVSIWDEKIAACTKIIEAGKYKGADSAWAFYHRARGKLAKGEVEPAIADFSQAIALSGMSQAYHARAEIYRTKGRNDLAIADANAALRGADKAAEPNILATRGGAYAAQGLLDAALGDFDASLAADPFSVFALMQRGTIYRTRRDFDKSLADFDAALKISTHAYVYKGRGVTYFFARKYDLARDDFSEVIKQTPNDGETYQLRGECQRELGQFDAAIDDATKAAEMLPGPPGANAYLTRATTYVLKGEIDKALPDFDKSIELNPRFYYGYDQRARAYEAKGDFTRALADATSAMQLAPALEASMRAYICWLHGTIGPDAAAGLRECEASLKLKPAVAQAMHAKGVVLFKMGNLADALTMFDGAVGADPNLIAARYCRGVVKMKQGDSEGGTVDTAAAEAVQPGIAEIYRKVGVAP